MGWTLKGHLVDKGDGTRSVEYTWDGHDIYLDHVVGILALIKVVFGFAVCCIYLLLYEKRAEVNQLKYEEQNDCPASGQQAYFKVYIVDSIILEKFQMSPIIHITCSLQGILINPIFYTLQLCLVFNVNETCILVYKAVFKNGERVLITLLMCVLFIYMFTSAMVVLFASDISEDYGEIKCTRQIECIFDLINQGFRNGGGIGDIMTIHSHDYSRYSVVFIFQILFYFTINVIFLNIMFGIIIDTFAELRGDEMARSDDRNNVCYVCGYTRTQFSALSKNFDNHINKQHYFWNYIYFLYYMNTVGVMDLSGVEQSANDSYQIRKTDWLPIQNTLYQENHDNAIFEDIKSGVDQIVTWLKKYDHELSRTTKGRLDIGMKKKEIHKQVVSKFDDKFVKCILNITTARSKIMTVTSDQDDLEIELPPKTEENLGKIEYLDFV